MKQRRRLSATGVPGAVELDAGTGAQQFLSVTEVAALLGVSVHTVYGMISERRLPFRYLKFGRRVLVDRREIERWSAATSLDAGR